MLESSKGNTVLIWDAVFPEAEKGKVYLYNTGKDAMVEYVEDIVSPKLRDLTDDEYKVASKEYSQGFQEIKSRYQEYTDDEVTPTSPAKNSTEMSSVIEEIDDDGIALGDEFEDL